ncbi:uncharacterized protein L969DRAFT_44897 [Mixia osmundae IAM 14324]|uniref:Transcription initiation factor TFIID subunit 11 n=1 Tax=Mixia osmundae (strain CBS 9802 / IAM 14324 / JCM 22182 / KY 12970) TaxID=764103 RepID=G7DXJ6_MIXOS|nr:uncharacterized protein L969DRAFT_44897 [Mixia osmundae IAM 14324]KEI41200.1 hypothetical protein L969DRAFT_44897 [Mixia osmundae IAM 14324]GAA95306.1 hypothetical protein E5Q_01963 [Mixia osmundae IAM 14324]
MEAKRHSDDEDEDGLELTQAELAQDELDRKEAIGLLLQHMSPEQMDRYETYRTSGLAKSAIKRLVGVVCQQTVSPNVIVVVRGFAKIFVGEIVELALKIQRDAGASGPLAPDHIREAYRQWNYAADQPGSDRKKLFVR